MSFILPEPPRSLSTSNPDLYNWAQEVKGKLERSHVLGDGIPITAPQTGDMAYKAPLAWARLSAGSNGQILTQGTSTAPVWGDISGNVAAGTGITVTGSNTATINAALAAGAGVSVSGTATRTIASNIVAGANVTVTGTATYTIASSFTPVAAGTGITINGTATNTINSAISGGTGISVGGTTPREINVNLAAGTGISIAGTTTRTISLDTPVMAKYITAAGQSIPDAAATVVNFGSAVYDNYSAVATGTAWVFKNPRSTSAYYDVQSGVLFNNTGPWSAAESVRMEAWVNGAIDRIIAWNSSETTNTDYKWLGGSITVLATSSGAIQIKVFQNSGSAVALLNDAQWNWVSISERR